VRSPPPLPACIGPVEFAEFGGHADILSRQIDPKEDPMRALIVALALVGMASPSLAQTMTGATITGVRTGWNADSFAVTTVQRWSERQRSKDCPSIIPIKFIVSIYISVANKCCSAGVGTAMIASSPSVAVTVHDTECFGNGQKV
jgi:hypothetical protein